MRILQIVLILMFLLLGAGTFAGSMHFKDDQWTGHVEAIVAAIFFALAFVAARFSPNTPLFQRRDRVPKGSRSIPR